MATTLDAEERLTVEQQRKDFAAQFPGAVGDPHAVNDPLGRRRGVQDEMTVRRMEKLISLEHRLRLTGVPAATIINMNPYQLRVNGVLLEDITVPPCPKGRPWSVHVIREHRISWKDETDDNWTPIESVPIILAREFEQAYYGHGGVVIFVGDAESNPQFLEDPRIVEKLHAAKLRMLGHAREMVTDANNEWNTPNRVGARNINEVHRSMAQLLLAEGLLAQEDRPVWLERTRAEANLGSACTRCKTEPKLGAYMCAQCGYILDPRQAYEAGEIEEDNVALRRISRADLEDMGVSEYVEETLEERAVRLQKKQPKPQAKAKPNKNAAPAQAQTQP